MANEILTRTPTSTGNRKVWTWAGWVKLSGADHSVLFSASGSNDTDRLVLGYYNNYFYVWGSSVNFIQSTRKVRDFGNWHHVLVHLDTTQPQSGQRLSLYINGVLEENFALDNRSSFTQNGVRGINRNAIHAIGMDYSAGSYHTKGSLTDIFFVDGQALTPDVFGFYKDGDGYQSSGTTNATDFRPGQWMPHAPRVIKKSIERSGGFGANGFYLPMNDSSNPGADFHCDPNSIIKLKGEDLPQPRNGAPTTSDAYVSQLRPEKEGTLGFDGVVKFDGDNDYLTIPDNEDFNIGSSDFTIELFLYKQNTSTYQHIFRQRDSGSAEMAVVLDIDSTGGDSFASGYFQMEWGSNKKFVGVNAGLNNDKWYHLALTKEGTTGRVFVDGVLVGTDTLENIGDYSADFYIGSWSGLSFYFRGFISNFRLIKGTALYTSNFTAPTEPLTNVTNTKLLCCNSVSSPIAATVTPDTITANGVVSGKNEIDTCLVLAVPGASTVIGADVVNNGYEWTGASGTTPPTGWTAEGGVATYSVNSSGQLVYDRNGDSATPARLSQNLTTVDGNTYHLVLDLVARTTGGLVLDVGSATNVFSSTTTTGIRRYTFTATSATTTIAMRNSSASGTLTIDNVKVKQVDNAPRDYSADIKGSGTNKTLTANGSAGVGYELGGYYGSAMTFDGTTDYVGTPITSDFAFGSGDFTIEYWQNAASYSGSGGVAIWDSPNNQRSWLIYQNSSALPRFYVSIDGTSANQYAINVSGLTMPTDQWIHYAMVRDGSTLYGYVNGVCVGSDANLGTQSVFTPVDPLNIGQWGASQRIIGSIQDLRIYKGLAKYKGGFDVPKPYTPVGIEAFRTTDDTCKNNFATWNSLVGAGMASGDNVAALKDGNLYYDNANQSWATSTIGVSSGKYYAEFMVTGGILSSNLGVCGDNRHGKNNQNYHTARGISYIRLNSTSVTKDYNATSVTETAGDAPLSYESGSIVGITIDYDNKEIKYYKNGTLIRTDSTPASYTPVDFAFYFLAFRTNDGASPAGSNWSDVIANFGQNPSFSGTTTAGTNADDSGKGLFKYAPPSGFLALCEDNLPTPAIADPGKHFKTVLWTGDGNRGRGITGVGFQPDLVWLKSRTNNASHRWSDSVRGVNKQLMSDSSADEATFTTMLTSFDSNGFSLGDNVGINGTGYTNVAWCWKAGGAAVSNNDGSITTQVSANPTAGFSIVKGTQTNGTTTFGHGLGKAPKMVITKQTNGTTGWYTWHTGIPITEALRLDADTNSTSFDHWVTDPTTSVFSMGSGFGSGETYVAYCFAEIEGYSKIGSYTGNGSTDGPFVYCGFKPAWVMVKNTSATSDWRIYDSSRLSTNPNNLVLYTNLSDVDTTTLHPFDLLSNGFKIRGDFNDINTSTHNYIFMAFAESPFQTANAK